MINALLSRICLLTCGTLYPGYISFKTVRSKCVEDYVKWITYWIVFSIFTAIETFTDIFLSWFPFYYELKVVLMLWLLPTVGDGSSLVYRNWLHPLLQRNEVHLDRQLEEFKEKGQDLVLHYIKEAFIFTGKSALNVMNKTFPNGIMGVLAYNGTMVPSDIIEEVVNNVNSSNTNVDDEEPRTSRSLSRRPRRVKTERQ